MKPRLTRDVLECRSFPKCPHCDGDMNDSTITLEDLASAWPVPAAIEVAHDGYARGHQSLVATCGWCAAPSAVAIDWGYFKLVAMRTEKDERYLGEQSGRRQSGSVDSGGCDL